MWLFETPKRPVPMGDTRQPLWCRYSGLQGLAVGLCTDGGYRQYLVVDPEAYPEVVTWWQGGRTHTVSDADAAGLTAAGYGPYLNPVTDE